MISLDFAQFSDKLFAVAHFWMLSIPACLEVQFESRCDQVGIVSEFTERIAWNDCL